MSAPASAIEHQPDPSSPYKPKSAIESAGDDMSGCQHPSEDSTNSNGCRTTVPDQQPEDLRNYVGSQAPRKIFEIAEDDEGFKRPHPPSNKPVKKTIGAEVDHAQNNGLSDAADGVRDAISTGRCASLTEADEAGGRRGFAGGRWGRRSSLGRTETHTEPGSRNDSNNNGSVKEKILPRVMRSASVPAMLASVGMGIGKGSPSSQSQVRPPGAARPDSAESPRESDTEKGVNGMYVQPCLQ